MTLLVHSIKSFSLEGDIDLITESTYNSSRIHVEYGGTLKRDISKHQYDIAPCYEFGEMVNTHKDAAFYLVKYLVKSTKP